MRRYIFAAEAFLCDMWVNELQIHGDALGDERSGFIDVKEKPRCGAGAGAESQLETVVELPLLWSIQSYILSTWTSGKRGGDHLMKWPD